MIVYNQKIKEGEQKVFLGEDALPYEKEGILLVADGLGGRGGYPHSQVKTQIVEKEGFFNLVFGDVFPYCPEDEEEKKGYEEFKEFVLDSFTEIFQTKDYYFTNSKTKRSSGYFASRLVVAILLYEIKYSSKCDKEQCDKEQCDKEQCDKEQCDKEKPSCDKEKPSCDKEKPSCDKEKPSCDKEKPSCDKEKLFKDLEKATTEEEKEEKMASFSNELAKRLREKLAQIAKNIKLVVETSLTGAYLLPSTVCLTLVNEKEDKVDAVYVWAGDSRGYFWDKDGGLGQVTDDHEKDETMYNLVSLSREFKLESRFVSFDKPCVLFNASDGCYKCSCYASPLEMEMTFLNIFSNAENFDVASKEFCEEYKRIGRHDDSNTMALHLYGYVDEEGKEDYGKFQEDVKKRKEDIEKHYVGQLEDIFETDYLGELEKIDERRDQIIFENASKWIEIPEVKAFVTQMMKDAKYEPYLQAIKDNEDSSAKYDEEIADLKKQAVAWFDEHKDKFGCFKDVSEAEFLEMIKPENWIPFANSDRKKHKDITEELSRLVEQLVDLEAKKEREKQAKDEIAEKFTMRFWRTRNIDVRRAIWEDQSHLLNKEEAAEIRKNLAVLEEENKKLIEKSATCDRLHREYQENYERKYISTKLLQKKEEN